LQQAWIEKSVIIFKILKTRNEISLINQSIGCEKNSSGVTVSVEHNGETLEMTSDVVLMSVGRKPNTDGLNLEAVGIKKIKK